MERKQFLKYFRFYITPFWREPEFSLREFEEAKIKSKRRQFSMFLYPLTISGFLIIIFIGILAVFPQWITEFSLREVTGPAGWTLPFQRPGWIVNPVDGTITYHFLGTTMNGYDIFGRLIWGARTALTMGIQSNLISVTGGVILGLIVAYFGGKTDWVVMRILDVIQTIPNFIFALFLISLVGSEMSYILMIYGILGIPGYCRFIRASVFQVKQNIFIRAAKTGGANDFKIMFKHVLPNAISPIIIIFFGSLGGTILGIASLTYIGMGDIKISDWGTDINWAQARFLSAPWAALWPGLLIALTVLAFMLIGDGLRDALDPRLRK